MTVLSEIDAPALSKELKKRWSYFIRKVYETDPLICAKCQGEMRIISFIDQPEVIKKILQHLSLSLTYNESLLKSGKKLEEIRGKIWLLSGRRQWVLG